MLSASLNKTLPSFLPFFSSFGVSKNAIFKFGVSRVSSKFISLYTESLSFVCLMLLLFCLFVVGFLLLLFCVIFCLFLNSC